MKKDTHICLTLLENLKLVKRKLFMKVRLTNFITMTSKTSSQQYNRQDVALLDKLDKKPRFIDPSNELAHANTVLLQTQWVLLQLQNKQLLQRSTLQRTTSSIPKRDDENTAAAGAYVAFPQKRCSQMDWSHGF